MQRDGNLRQEMLRPPRHFCQPAPPQALPEAGGRLRLGSCQWPQPPAPALTWPSMPNVPLFLYKIYSHLLQDVFPEKANQTGPLPLYRPYSLTQDAGVPTLKAQGL